MKSWYIKNKDDYKKRVWEYHQKRKITPHYKFLKYRLSAKNRNIEFKINENEFNTFWQKPCYYCGDKIKMIGIDRLDNKKGYELSNIVSCCETCNRMKMIMHHKKFICQCKKITNYIRWKV